ncbi:MAG: membrane protein insertase YidC [Alphaproteobacteria bacterium]|nr:membrane protein insertase YidC [Alphaproteobacteria bacterium]
MNNKENMHPDDFRNLVIFAILSVTLWFVWDNYITRPQMEKLEKAKKAKAELMVAAPEIMEPVTFIERQDAIDKSLPQRVTFENEHIKGSILLKGARIDDIRLKDYFETLEKKENVHLLSPEQTQGSRYIDSGWVSQDENIKLPDSDSMWTVGQGGHKLTPGHPLTLTWDNGQGLTFERKITMDELYGIKVEQTISNNTQAPVTVLPYALLAQMGIPKDFTGRWTAYEGPMGFIGGELVHADYHAMLKERKAMREAETGWLGITDKYWLTALIPAQAVKVKYRFLLTPDPIHPEMNRYQADFTGSARAIGTGQSSSTSFDLYLGSKKVSILEAYEKQLGIPNFDLALDFGWFWFFTYPFHLALDGLGQITGNMGIAIIIMTVVLRTMVYPLTKTTFRSFAKMRVVQPQIVEIRDKFSDDKERMQQEIMEVYRENGVNPLSGCLPALVQIPIFFALYKIIFVSIELRQAPFFGWIQDLSAPDPTSIFNLFGLIPWTPPAPLMIGVWPCVMLCVMLVQKRLTPPPQDPIQRDMRNYFPFIITYVMSHFASGLVIYWTFSGMISSLQQAYIMKSFGVPIHLFDKDKTEKELEKKVTEGPPIHPLIEMAEEDAEKALFGEDETPSVIPGPEEGGEETNVVALKPPKPKKKKKKK